MGCRDAWALRWLDQGDGQVVGTGRVVTQTGAGGGAPQTTQHEKRGERSSGYSPSPHGDKAQALPVPKVFLGQAFTVVVCMYGTAGIPKFFFFHFFGLLIFQAPLLP